MEVICITQARLTSTRLPGKVLLPLFNGMNSIDILSERLSRSKKIDRHLFVVPEDAEDRLLCEYLTTAGLEHCQGSANDLVKRYLKSLDDVDDCIIVRVTSDCPLVDYKIVDSAISTFLEGQYDYVSNYTPAEESRFCNGSDVEVLTKSTLLRLFREFPARRDREHVTFPLWDGRLPDIRHFRMSPGSGIDYSDIRITLDYTEDAFVIEKILKLAGDLHCSLEKIAEIYRTESLKDVNGNHHYAEGWV